MARASRTRSVSAETSARRQHLFVPPHAGQIGEACCPIGEQGRLFRFGIAGEVAVDDGVDGGVPRFLCHHDAVRLAAQDQLGDTLGPPRGERGRDLVPRMYPEDVRTLDPQRVEKSGDAAPQIVHRHRGRQWIGAPRPQRVHRQDPALPGQQGHKARVDPRRPGAGVEQHQRRRLPAARLGVMDLPHRRRRVRVLQRRTPRPASLGTLGHQALDALSADRDHAIRVEAADRDNPNRVNPPIATTPTALTPPIAIMPTALTGEIVTNPTAFKTLKAS